MECILAPGRYRIEVKQTGFQDGAAVVDLKEGQVVEQSIQLRSPQTAPTENPFRGAHEGELTGTVYDESHAVIPSALVEIQAKSPLPANPVYRIRTDNSGKYAAKLAIGEYTVTATMQHFTTEVSRVRIHGEGKLILDFTLHVRPIVDGVWVEPSH